MQHPLILLFGVVSYGIFFLTFLYLIAFVGNLQATALADAFPLLRELVPHSVDRGRDTGSLAGALAIDLGLIALFGMQHTVMARQGFKRAWTRIVPAAAERSVYVLIASLVLIVLFWQWRPIPAPLVWEADAAWSIAIGWMVFVAGFGLVLLSTFLINHFHLFGLQQSLWHFLGRDTEEPHFVTPLLYRLVRHPLYLGFVLAFWGTPAMSLGHLVLAIGMSSYILIAIQYEERDLVGFHGEKYRRYREEVPMLVPLPGRMRRG